MPWETGSVTANTGHLEAGGDHQIMSGLPGLSRTWRVPRDGRSHWRVLLRGDAL